MTESSNPLHCPAIDAHTHLFPKPLSAAIQRTLSRQMDWSFAHPLDRENIEEIYKQAGVEHYVALPYIHEPEGARELNQWLCDQARQSDMMIPFATVHPSDDNPEKIVREAFQSGAKGLKFHCPVQQCYPADTRIEPALEVATSFNRPVTYHGGTAPMFRDSKYVGIKPFKELIRSFPDLRVCCAHMGTYQHEEFIQLARERDNVYLDTTFAMSAQAKQTMGFDPRTISNETFIELSGSIMYGSDFPNIPYDYREERADLLDRELPDEVFRDIFYHTSQDYLCLENNG